MLQTPPAEVPHHQPQGLPKQGRGARQVAPQRDGGREVLDGLLAIFDRFMFMSVSLSICLLDLIGSYWILLDLIGSCCILLYLLLS